MNLIDEKGEKIGRLKNIQHEKKSIDEATEGMEITMALPGINFERVLSKKNFLYTDIGEKQFKDFKKNFLINFYILFIFFLLLYFDLSLGLLYKILELFSM